MRASKVPRRFRVSETRGTLRAKPRMSRKEVKLCSTLELSRMRRETRGTLRAKPRMSRKEVKLCSAPELLRIYARESEATYTCTYAGTLDVCSRPPWAFRPGAAANARRIRPVRVPLTNRTLSLATKTEAVLATRLRRPGRAMLCYTHDILLACLHHVVARALLRLTRASCAAAWIIPA